MLTVNQFSTAGQIVGASDLLSVMPSHLIALNRMESLLVAKKLPFTLPGLKIDLLWHERDVRDPALKWVRSTLRGIADRCTSTIGQGYETDSTS
jgi:DNA-binding transcriptional LysR family regulator